MTLRLSHCIAVAGLLGALLFAPATALADGTFEFQSDQSHILVHSKTTDGVGAFNFAYTFPQAITDAKTTQGVPCELNFRQDPKIVRCAVPLSATGAPQSSLDVAVVAAAPLACTDTIALESNINRQTPTDYRPDGTIVFSGNCPPANPPPGNPPPNPPPPDPNEQPAGGPVSKPLAPIVASAGAGAGPIVKTFQPPNLPTLFQFFAFDPAFHGGVRVAAGDVNGDGVVDVIAGAGPGGGPHIKVFDGSTGNLLQSFLAFDPAFQGGVFVAAGDVNGDGHADVVVGADSGAGPAVKVFSGADGSLLESFFAFDPSFNGGVRVAAGDVNGDGKADVVVGAGPGGGPQVKVFNGAGGGMLKSFFAFDPGFHGGVFVAAGDVNGDGRADIVTSPDTGGGPQVKVLSGNTLAVLSSFFAYGAGFTGGVRVAVGDVNGDGTPDVITGTGPGGGPQLKVFDGGSGSTLKSMFAFDPSLTTGFYVGAATFPGATTKAGTFTFRGDAPITLNTTCPALAKGGCTGRITLLLPAVQKVRGKGGHTAATTKRRLIVLGTSRFKAAAGQTVKVKLRLSKKGRRAVGKKKKTKGIVRIVSRDGGGNVCKRQVPVTLKFT